MCLAHDPPPITVNHITAPKGIPSDSDFTLRALEAAGDGLWIGGVAFSAADIQSVEVTESSAILSQWELKLKFTTSGNAKFIDAQRCGPGSIVEISLDRKVLSQPQLIETILGGEASVSGSTGHDEWLEIAKRIPVATP
jgi:preprotein translocase subunit SecD